MKMVTTDMFAGWTEQAGLKLAATSPITLQDLADLCDDAIQSRKAVERAGGLGLDRTRETVRDVRRHMVGAINSLGRLIELTDKWQPRERELGRVDQVEAMERTLRTTWERFGPIFETTVAEGRQPVKWLGFAQGLYSDLLLAAAPGQRLRGGRNDRAIAVVASAVGHVFGVGCDPRQVADALGSARARATAKTASNTSTGPTRRP